MCHWYTDVLETYASAGPAHSLWKYMKVQGGITSHLKQKKKHAAFKRKFIDPEKQYVLLFNDFELVDNIPGTSQPFSLQKYKDMIGKKYNRISFYLCDADDYFGKIFWQ